MCDIETFIRSKIYLGLPLTEHEKAYAVLYMGYNFHSENNK